MDLFLITRSTAGFHPGLLINCHTNWKQGTLTSNGPEIPRGFRLKEVSPLATMEDYFSAVRKMEQTVMFPSVLQGVPLEWQDNTPEADSGGKDLYDYYTLLKSMKLVVEGGLLPLSNQNPDVASRLKEQEEKEKQNPEGYFYYHVSSLYRVLAQLTRRANAVTSKYNEIMGQINQGEIHLG
uniref:thyroid hormone-inducible hepatic protein n=1 Tax=Podarcis muralis TaxID=64176 RepID=UPI00109F2A3C|nr:thyroid hormone-inducible hepatic protein [Podarcis muralis]